MGSVEVLVIDGARQLKECEGLIPLQLSGVKHAVLIGDELQLPAPDKTQEQLSGVKHAVLIGDENSMLFSSKKMGSVEVLVIDGARQLKECEGLIPLQLSGVKHAVLIGDELQLPAPDKTQEQAVKGNISYVGLMFGHYWT